MQMLRDTKAIQAAASAASIVSPYVAQRVQELSEYHEDLAVLVNIFVVEPADTLADLSRSLGFSSSERQPDAIENHPAVYELTYVLSDDGFGLVVYVPKGQDIDRHLLELCSREAERGRN